MYLIEIRGYTIKHLSYFGTLECFIILALILINLSGIAVITIKNIVEFIMSKLSPKKVAKISLSIIKLNNNNNKNSSTKISTVFSIGPQKLPLRRSEVVSLKPIFEKKNKSRSLR